MLNTRREWIAGAIGLPPALSGAGDRIRSVTARAGVLALKAPAVPRFRGDDDPARSRWFGPFAQLTGAILVEVRTTNGLTGYGLGGGGGAAVYIIERHLRDLLVGARPNAIETLWSQLYSSSSFYGRRGLAVMAISGIDLALWDIAGKAAGKPVCELLGGSAGRPIPGYYTGANLRWARERGFRAFKLPVSSIAPEEGERGLSRLQKLVEEARETVGREAGLMLDCLGRWTVPFTLAAARRLVPFGIRWFEEPLMPDDIEGYAELCRKVKHTRIAAGEHEYTRYGFAELIRRKAVHVLQPDISWSGGLSELRRIAALPGRGRLPIAPHRGGSLYGLHFMAATPGCGPAENFGVGENGTAVMRAMTARFEDGCFVLPEKPGFGVEIAPDELRAIGYD